MISFPFQQQHTYRKLGYLYFTDSLDYRTVLEENPQWNVTELPPLGAQMRVTATQGDRGGLAQGSFLFGQASGSTQQIIYPYDTEKEYVLALARYSGGAVANRQTINGLTADTTEAFTGKQG
jgi:hypothetical protein